MKRSIHSLNPCYNGMTMESAARLTMKIGSYKRLNPCYNGMTMEYC